MKKMALSRRIGMKAKIARLFILSTVAIVCSGVVTVSAQASAIGQLRQVFMQYRTPMKQKVTTFSREFFAWSSTSSSTNIVQFAASEVVDEAEAYKQDVQRVRARTARERRAKRYLFIAARAYKTTGEKFMNVCEPLYSNDLSEATRRMNDATQYALDAAWAMNRAKRALGL